MWRYIGYCQTCAEHESFEIKRYLSELDSRAFVTVMQVKAVWGEGKGFSDIDELFCQSLLEVAVYLCTFVNNYERIRISLLDSHQKFAYFVF